MSTNTPASANGSNAGADSRHYSHSAPPSILPFTVLSYDGHLDEDESGDIPLPITQTLLPDTDLYHCSKPGRNFDLVLQYMPSLPLCFALTCSTDHAPLATVTHVVIHGPFECTAPIGRGVVFLHEQQPKPSLYTDKYDDLTSEQYDAIPLATRQADGALAYFTVDNIDTLQVAIPSPTWTTCGYVHIKLIAPLDEDEDNIDIARIAVVGYSAEEAPHTPFQHDTNTLLTGLGLLREELTAWNRFSQQHLRLLDDTATCILFVADPTHPSVAAARAVVESVAKSADYGEDDELTFFLWDEACGGKQFAAKFAFAQGVDLGIDIEEDKDDDDDADMEEEERDDEEEEGPMNGANGTDGAKDHEDEESVEDGEAAGVKAGVSARVPVPPFSLVISIKGGEDKFRYAGDMTEAAVRQWLEVWRKGKLQSSLRSQPRPAGDKDAQFANVTAVTADTFQELVLDSTKHVLLFALHREENRTVTAVMRYWLQAASTSLRLPSLLLASFDGAENDNPTALPPDAVPGVVLYAAADKSPQCLEELPDTVDTLLAFLQAGIPNLNGVAITSLSSSPALLSAAAYTEVVLQCDELLARSETYRAASTITSEQQRMRWRRATRRVEPILKQLTSKAPKWVEDDARREKAVNELSAVCELWQPIVDKVEEGRALMAEVTDMLGGGMLSQLSEEDVGGIGMALAQLSMKLPPPVDAEKAEEEDDEDVNMDDDDDEGEEEEEEDGEAESAFDLEQLEQCMQAMQQVRLPYSPRTTQLLSTPA